MRNEMSKVINAKTHFLATRVRYLGSIVLVRRNSTVRQIYRQSCGPYIWS